MQNPICEDSRLMTMSDYNFKCSLLCGLTSKLQKLCATVGFISIILSSIIVLVTPSASGYEISLYDAYPPVFWLLLILSLSSGIILMVDQAFFKKITHIWMTGPILIIISNLFILLLPVIRGYIIFGRDDPLTHIGYINDILSTGYFTKVGFGANHYPADHILAVDLVYLTGLKPSTIVMIVPVIFFLIFIVSMYAFARELSLSDGQALLICAFSSLPLFKMATVIFVPSNQTFFLTPIIFFLYFKFRKPASHVTPIFLALLPFLLILPFYHPGEGTILFITIILIHECAYIFYNIVKKNTLNITHDDVLKSIKYWVMPITILVIAEIAWFVQFPTFAHVTRFIVESMQSSPVNDFSMRSVEIISMFSVSQSIQIFFNMWGQLVIYLLIGSFSLIITWKAVFLEKHVRSEQFIFSVVFLFSILLVVVAFVGNVYLPLSRVVKWAIFSAGILGGLTLYSLYINGERVVKNIIPFLIITALVLSTVFCVYNTFYSPIVRVPNQQVTDVEVDGMSWFFNNRIESLPIDEEGIEHIRFFQMLYGRSTVTSNIRTDARAPVHFGYLEHETLGKSFHGEDRYLIITNLGRINFPSIIPEFEELWLFTPDDYYKLDYGDSTVCRIYYNGNLCVHYVYV